MSRRLEVALVTDAMPTTSRGKVRKKELLAWWLDYRIREAQQDRVFTYRLGARDPGSEIHTGISDR
jgi:hypothetical protein